MQRLVQKVVYFGSQVQKVVYFPSDNSDLLSSHFSVQSEVHYFWDLLSSHFCVQSEVHYFWGLLSSHFCVQSILRASVELSQPLILCFVPLPVQQYCNQSSYPYCRYYRYVSSIYTTTILQYGSGSNESQQRINHFSLASLLAVVSN